MHYVRGGGLEGYPELVRSLGYAPGELLDRVGLDYSVTRQPDRYVPYAKVARLLRISAEECDDDLFGLKLSSLQGRRTLGILGLFMAMQPSIGEALAMAERLIRLHASGVFLEHVDMGRHSLFELTFDLSEDLGLGQLRQLSVGLLYRIVQRLAGAEWRPTEVVLRQPPPRSGPQEMERFFGCPVSFESELDGILARKHLLEQRPEASPLQVQSFLDEHVRMIEADFPGDLVAQVRQTVISLLPLSECSLQNVARLLDLHPRVLQKRLAAEGTGFRRLLEDARLMIARHHLQHTEMSLTELALQLGFAEIAVFTRAFRRWTGQTPSAWRRLHAHGATVANP